MDPAGRCGGVYPDRPGDRLNRIRSSQRRVGLSVEADGRDPAKTKVEDVKSDKVLYCFKGDDVADAAQSMRKRQVYRLIVLDSRDNKKLCGVISLGDILRHKQSELAEQTAEAIVA